jgi:hypothetical protein
MFTWIVFLVFISILGNKCGHRNFIHLFMNVTTSDIWLGISGSHQQQLFLVPSYTNPRKTSVLSLTPLCCTANAMNNRFLPATKKRSLRQTKWVKLISSCFLFRQDQRGIKVNLKHSRSFCARTNSTEHNTTVQLIVSLLLYKDRWETAVFTIACNCPSTCLTYISILFNHLRPDLQYCLVPSCFRLKFCFNLFLPNLQILARFRFDVSAIFDYGSTAVRCALAAFSFS